MTLIDTLLRLGLILTAVGAVTACGGGSGGSDSPGSTSSNSPPIVDAGAAQTVDELTEVVLSGSARDNDGTIRSYRWTQVSGPTVELVDADTAQAGFTAPDGSGGSAELVFRLTVTDDDGAAANDEVTVGVDFRNSPPSVDAGIDQDVEERTEVVLSGSAEDDDGSIRSYRWTQVSGPTVELVNTDAAEARFTAPDGRSGSTDLTFRLTVTDDSGGTAGDDVIVTVTFGNNPPTVRAGGHLTIAGGFGNSFSVPAQDTDGTIQSYEWEQVSGPETDFLTDPDGRLHFNSPHGMPDGASGTIVLVFRLTVTDDQGATATSEVTFTVTAADAVRVFGRITFDYVPAVKAQGLQYSSTEARPARGVTVELRDGVDDGFLDVVVTDENGEYAVYAQPGASVFVRVRAEIPDESGFWDVRVVNSDHGTPGCESDADYVLYGMDSEPFVAPDTAVTKNFHAASGWTGSGYGNDRAAAPFAILDVVFDAMQYVRLNVGDIEFRPLYVAWGTMGTGASHSSCRDKSVIRLGGAENENTDEYDRTVIAHEWGHYFQASFSRNDTLGGAHNALFDHFEIATAFSEGFASALGALAANDSGYLNTFGPQQGRTAGFSTETVTHTVRGWFNEASIAQIVYDLVDPVNEDTVELGFRPIFDVLVGDFRQTRSVTSIFSFIHALKNQVPEYASAIDAVVGYHRIQPIADEWGSMETNASGKAVPEVLPVYSELVVNGGAVNGCSVDSYGAIRTGRYNKLGIRRYIRFRAESEGEYAVSATLTSVPPDKQAWPVLRLRTAGRDGGGDSKQCSRSELGSCVLTTVLDGVSAGDNVLVLWDEGNAQMADPNRGRKCFDVEITRR